jgi:carboxyl-terminal processing protease
MTKLKQLRYIILPVVVLVVFFFVFGGTKIFRSFSRTEKEYQYLALFSEVISLVKSDYVETLQPEEKFPGAFSGMLSSLDEFSAYLDTRQTRLYNLYLQDKACNCGIYGIKYSNYFYITDIAVDSPAEKNGIKPGSIIKAVNGKSIFGQSFWQMYFSLLSEKPETIELVLLKESSTLPYKVKLHTETIKNAPIIQKIRENIYLLELSRIDEEHLTALNRQLKQIQIQESNPGTKPLKLIIDLRKYRGGDLDAFIRLTELFFAKTTPLTLTLKTKSLEKTFSLGADEPLTYHAVVILNQSTMMYGELLANLFQVYQSGDTSVVTLVGSKTRGFISKLRQLSLSDETSILLSEGLFLLNGKNPAQNGVKPDVTIKEEDFATIIDRSISILNKTDT